ncbi:MAG TPA: class I SAM-dependent methyltransferase [Nitrospirota bacterium]|nr:class I SAM-dependent methyltransferase [Nitrospirota bacterium]
MLYELFTSLTTSCPAYVRHMHYLYEAIAMRGRYHRNRKAWQPHLDNSRAFLLAAAERCKNKSSVAVYGAGLLLDVPLRELASRFEHVYLLDIVFLREARQQARQFSNVALVQHDAANIAETFHNNVQRGIVDLPEPSIAPPECVQQADLVVSLNLLSQLWVMPREYALKNIRNLDEEQLGAWCGRIVQSHYALLQSLTSQVCLIADHTYVKRDKAGTIVNQGSTVFGLSLPQPAASWTWDIAPIGENKRFLSKELIVGAWHLR